MTTTATTKACKGCGIKKSLSEYHANSKMRDRHLNYCKHCVYLASKYDRKYDNVRLFGGMRELALKRDGYKCTECGMTTEEHLRKYNRQITVDHIDGHGRHTPKIYKNNSLEDLQTLCLPCHGRKDRLRYLKDKRSVQIGGI